MSLPATSKPNTTSPKPTRPKPRPKPKETHERDDHRGAVGAAGQTRTAGVEAQQHNGSTPGDQAGAAPCAAGSSDQPHTPIAA
jgi:hypothetical protein